MVIRGQMMILMMPFQREKLLGMAELLFPTPGEEKEEKEEEEEEGGRRRRKRRMRTTITITISHKDKLMISSFSMILGKFDIL